MKYDSDIIINEIEKILNTQNIFFIEFGGSKKIISFFVKDGAAIKTIGIHLPEKHDYKKIHEIFLNHDFLIMYFRYIHVNKYEDYYNVVYQNGKRDFSYRISEPNDRYFCPGMISVVSNEVSHGVFTCEKPALELVNRLDYTDRIKWFLLLEKSANKLNFKFYDTEFSKYDENEKLYGKLMLL